MVANKRRLRRNGFREIVDELRAAIESGEIVAGAMLPTERELCETYEAGRSTIRKCLDALVADGWGVKVPNRGVMATRGIRRGRTNRVALVHGSSVYFRKLVPLFQSLLKEHDLELVELGSVQGYPQDAALNQAAELEFAGAFVWRYAGFSDPDRVGHLGRQLPIVALDHPLDRMESDRVTFDHEEATRLATSKLLQAGCLHVGITGMFDMLPITQMKLNGFLRGMLEVGLQPRPSDFLPTHTSGMDEIDPLLLELRMAQPSPPDGLIVLQDSFLAATLKALDRVLPADSPRVKVVSIGDTGESSARAEVIGGIVYDDAEMVRHAVNLLVARLAQLDAPFQTHVVPHRYVETA